MYLKKLEIAGFKSFANKTVIDFVPSLNDDGDFRGGRKSSVVGITAIVGPNGSGKSNIADAIRWAMGEQSMKNLRGKKSEDIIFAGSGKKGKLSYATVALHFDNSDKQIPVDFSEVIIKRKIYRSGDTEYSINGSRARLIDIVDILAKAGVGKDSYSVLNQGMSDAVLNASPSERRVILEDAAGVKQYQIKKNRALKKMDTTLKNMQQAQTLLAEIEPHLRSLKRQAGKAQKSKELKKELKILQKKYYAFLWFDFQSKQRESLELKQNLGREMMNKQKEVDKLNDFVITESDKMRRDDRVDKLKKEKSVWYEKLNRLEKEEMILAGKAEILKEKLKQVSVIRSVPVDKNYIKNELKEVYRQYEELLNRIEKIKEIKELKEVIGKLKRVKEIVRNLQMDIDKGEIAGKKTREQLDEEKKIENLLKENESEKLKINKRKEEIKSNIEKINKTIEEEAEANRKAREDFFKKEAELRETRRELDQLKDKFNEAKISLAKIEVREDDLKNSALKQTGLNIEKIEFDGKKIDVDETEQRIFRIKNQLEQIGGIDPLIMEEYEETNQRYETLQKEIEDLQRAVVSLEKVAKEMDKKIEKVFKKAFASVNREFSKYFKIIFGGGKAYLKKVKKTKNKTIKKTSDDLKEIRQDKAGVIGNEGMEEENNENKEDELGVEIFACPPGKKINSLAMLSGGERSLTSLALLFAIISYNPPPFAVLDEVEAALDEANSLRFGKILKELSQHTQFIAITHNRETMRQASYLYGATMGDDGVTKLLSVKLDETK